MAENRFAKYAQPSEPPKSGGYTIGTPDPYRPRDEARKDDDQAMERERLRLAQQAAALAATNANKPAEGYEAAPGGGWRIIPGGPADPAVLATRAAAIEAAKPGATKAGGRAGALQTLLTQIQRVEDLYGSTLKGGLPNGIAGRVPGIIRPENDQFTAASAGMAEQGLAAFRVPGVGSQSDSELRQFVEANRPLSSDADLAIEEKLRTLRLRANSELQSLGANPGALGASAGGRNGGGATGNSGYDRPATPFDNPNNQGGGGQSIATGATREVPDDRLGSMLNSMYNAGASKEAIDAAIAPYGGQPIDPKQYAAARAWMRANPGKAYNGGYAVRHEPLSVMQKISGSAPGAFAAQMSDTFTGGIASALAGDKGKGALDAMGAMYPNASAAGSVIGGVTGAASLEAGLAARAPAALARYAPRVADAIFGGVTGYTGANDGEGAKDAVIGALMGTAGGAVGERAMRGVGSVARGLRDPAVDYLRAAGVPMTVGQILAQTGSFGRGVKKVEDALTSVPFLGNIVEARRRDGIAGFNRAAFDIGAETTGGQVQDYGSAGIRQLDVLKNDAYDRALAPVRLDATDPDLINDLGATINAAQTIPDVNGAQGAAMAGLQTRIDGAVDPLTDTIDGRGFQEAYRGLARTGRERANGDYGHEVGQVMRQGQDALVGAMQRQQPGAYEGFVDANTANRRLNVLSDAVNKAKNQEDEMFFPSQLNMADAGSARRLTGNISSAAGNRPFHELATAGQEILPSRLGDSGTASRAMVGMALGGGAGAGAGYLAGDTGTGAGMGVAATLALALGGSQRAQAAAARILLDRPDVAVRIGESLQRNSRIGGAVGAGGALSMAQILGMGGP